MSTFAQFVFSQKLILKRLLLHLEIVGEIVFTGVQSLLGTSVVEADFDAARQFHPGIAVATEHEGVVLLWSP